jgi:hypothetical protein
MIHHLILYDFGIHWFDIVSCFFRSRQATRVSASAVKAAGQTVIPPYLAHAAIEYPNGLATLSFNGLSKFGGDESVTLVGSTGTIHCDDPLCEGTNRATLSAIGCGLLPSGLFTNFNLLFHSNTPLSSLVCCLFLARHRPHQLLGRKRFTSRLCGFQTRSRNQTNMGYSDAIWHSLQHPRL